jgi:NADP-dependent 3-hydroxy acid dehydrogenase YdfG
MKKEGLIIDMKDIKDKLIGITGGVGGIGRLTALDFVGQGGMDDFTGRVFR